MVSKPMEFVTEFLRSGQNPRLNVDAESVRSWKGVVRAGRLSAPKRRRKQRIRPMLSGAVTIGVQYRYCHALMNCTQGDLLQQE